MGMRKKFCPNFPKIARKNFGPLLCDFHVTLGAIFSNQSKLGAIFARIFMEFA